MKKYIDRLIKCGYGEARAHDLCVVVLHNLPLYELENLVTEIERNVGILQ